MSGQALRDLNVLPLLELDKKTDNSGKGNIMKPCIGNTDENHEKMQTKFPTSALNEVCEGKNVAEAGNSEVEYIDSENLTDLQDVNTCLTTLLARLDAKEWVSICEALNNVRQLSLYHKEKMIAILNDIIPLVVKSLKNPRSAVCKTAIMTSADIFKAYSDNIIDSFEPLVVQLLLKSSQDKRFVCEAAEAALIAMTTWISPILLLPKLQPYLKHKNPRIRAKVSMCFSRSVPRLGMEGIKSYGIDKLIQTAASQLSDQLPESREAARLLTLELQSTYEKVFTSPSEDSEQVTNADPWDVFCQSKLPPLSAQAILRVTSTNKEAATGC